MSGQGENTEQRQHQRGRGRGGYRGRGRGQRGHYRGNRGGNRPHPQGEVVESTTEDFVSRINDNDCDIEYENQDSPFYSINSFDDMIEKAEILQAVYDCGFDKPSKIQCQAIPNLAGPNPKDIIAQAQSGSGKTVAFITSMLLKVDPSIKSIQAICLCHTRELTLQSFDVFADLNEVAQYSGGIMMNNYEDPPEDAQLIFGTPLAIKTMIIKKKLDVSNVKILIVDEADEIMGTGKTLYAPTVQLIKLLPQTTVIGFFSATFSNDSIGNIKQVRRNVIQIRLKRQEQRVNTISHWGSRVNNDDEALQVLLDLIKLKIPGQSIIFADTKQKSFQVKKFLEDNGYISGVLNSDLKPEERDEIIEKFRNSEIKFLVSTNVISRALNVPAVFLVVNIDLPTSHMGKQRGKQPDTDCYVHRSGRAGRFGRTGICFSFIKNDDDLDILKTICGQLNIKLNMIDKNRLDNLPNDEDTANPPQEEVKTE